MPVDFADVSEALHALYDSLGLAQSRLCASFPVVAAEQDPVERARVLRAILLEAIELLQPARPGSFLSSTARSYQVLTLHYVDGLSLVKIADELHISRRQAYRDLAQALDKLAEFLGARDWSIPNLKAPTESDDPLLQEIDRLAAHVAPIDLLQVARTSIDIVDSLAKNLDVDLAVHLPSGEIIIHASEDLLRQTLVKMLSVVIRHVHDGHASLHVNQERDITLCARLCPRSEPGLFAEFPTLRHLAQAQGLRLDAKLDSEGRMALILIIPRRQKLILIIEDNESTANLFIRYLANMRDWEIVTAQDPVESIELAKRHTPDLILLDIMMPGTDGWSLLQNLRTQPETTDTPIVVCTVFDEIELARTLGASGYLKKPVSQIGLQRELARHLEPMRNSA